MIMNSKKYLAAGIIIGLFTPFFWSSLSFNGNSGDQLTTIISNEEILPSPSEFVSVDTWWNESFRFRVQLEIIEPGIAARENEAISTWLSFENGTHSINSTRVIQYATDAWTEVPCQVSNRSLDLSEIFILNCTITFMVTNIMKSQNLLYFIYYTDNYEDIDNKTAIYEAQTSLTATLSSTKVSADTGQIQLEFNNASGVDLLKITGKSTNYHNNLSIAPAGSLDKNLQAYWKFDDGAGTTARDSTGNAYTGTVYGGAAWSSDAKYGGSLFFDGVDDYVGITIDVSEVAYAFTCWFKAADTTGRGLFNIVDGLHGAGGHDRHVGLTATAGQIRTRLWSNEILTTTSTGWNNGQWHHITYTYGSAISGEKIYIDGVLQPGGSGSKTSSDFNWQKMAEIGYSADNLGSTWFKGWIDDVRIYNKALSVDEVKLAMSASSRIVKITPAETGPVFSAFNLNWEDSGDARISDDITIYSDQKMYKVERTFLFNNFRSPNSIPRNNSFVAVNPLYPQSGFSQYIYDGVSVDGLSSTSFEPHNYTLIRNKNGQDYLTTAGIFVTNLARGNELASFNDLWWKIDYASSAQLVNMLPGNWTDLNNLGSDNWISHPENNFTVTFWEFIDDYFGTQDQDAHGLAQELFQKITNPLIVVAYTGDSESRFYNLDVVVTDWDGNPAPGVNVTLVNATDGTHWDFDLPNPKPTKMTNAEGVAQFVRQTKSNYTINLTYCNFDKTLCLSGEPWDNVTLDTSQTLALGNAISINNVNLTRLSLYFRQYLNGELTTPIMGGTVSFYTNRSESDEEFVGNVTADTSGLAEFFWARYPESVANTTFELNFLGRGQSINISVDEWREKITVLANGTATYSVGVNIGDFSTDLDVITGYSMTSAYWGEILTINVNYTFTLQPTIIGDPIIDADVSYILSTTTSKSNSFNTSAFVATAQPGIYEFILDTTASWLQLDAQTNYYMIITATKNGYSTVTQTVTINLQNITTNLIASRSTIQVYWLDNISASDARFYFNDTLHNLPITGARLRYSVPNLPSVSGLLHEEGAGWYNFTLNSTVFVYTGSYILTITADVDNFAKDEIDINLQVLQIRTYIGSWSNPNQQQLSFVQTVRINVTTRLVMWFNYTDSNGNGIPNAAIAEYEWQDTLGGKHIDFLNDEGNGNYSLDFDTANRPIDDYSLVVTIGQTNYKERSCVIILAIEPIPIIVYPVRFTQGIPLKVPQGETLTITIDLYDPLLNAPLTGATVILNFDGEDRPMLPTSTPGRYEIVLSTATFNALFAQIDYAAKIYINKTNYKLGTEAFIFTIGIAPPEMLGIPTIYWIIAIVAIGAVIGIMLSVKAVQRARIPQIIKDITVTRILIKKRRSIELIQISPTKAELIHKLVEGKWATIGLNLSTFGKEKGEETRPEPEKLEKKEASG